MTWLLGSRVNSIWCCCLHFNCLHLIVCVYLANFVVQPVNDSGGNFQTIKIHTNWLAGTALFIVHSVIMKNGNYDSVYFIQLSEIT